MGTEKRRILIVEDEKNIAMLLSFNLGRAGFDTDVAEDGEIGLRKALSDKFDIVLLDIMLPKLDGFKVLEGIRTRSNVPVIMVTARDDEKDKILGLENGADDYITKPFSINEVIARIRANIRRHKEYELLLFLMQNPGVPFSREDLLEKVWGYGDFLGDVNTVDVTVSRLRKKLERDPSNPEYLITKRGVGYYIQ